MSWKRAFSTLAIVALVLAPALALASPVIETTDENAYLLQDAIVAHDSAAIETATTSPTIAEIETIGTLNLTRKEGIEAGTATSGDRLLFRQVAELSSYGKLAANHDGNDHGWR